MPNALHDHLIRLLVWGALSVLAGLILHRRPFGLMTAGWGGVNLVIALASLRGGPPGPGLRPFLAFNLGLDLGYVGVGLAMILLAGERTRIKEFGAAVALQGVVLLLLDGWLWLGIV